MWKCCTSLAHLCWIEFGHKSALTGREPGKCSVVGGTGICLESSQPVLVAVFDEYFVILKPEKRSG